MTSQPFCLWPQKLSLTPECNYEEPDGSILYKVFLQVSLLTVWVPVQGLMGKWVIMASSDAPLNTHIHTYAHTHTHNACGPQMPCNPQPPNARHCGSQLASWGPPAGCSLAFTQPCWMCVSCVCLYVIIVSIDGRWLHLRGWNIACQTQVDMKCIQLCSTVLSNHWKASCVMVVHAFQWYPDSESWVVPVQCTWK
jgi:hypothetical protein